MTSTAGDTTALTRREVLKAGAAAGGALALHGLAPGLLRALAAGPAAGRLEDIEHFVIVIQENRSFDHYFGTLSGVRGYADPAVMRQPGGRPIFYQPYAANSSDPPAGYLLPFRLDTENTNAMCTPDITHEWRDQHRMWNGGRMDRFAEVHTSVDPGQDGLQTMAYYTRADLPFYYAVADAFTICDSYHCSVIGPTDPNRLMSMTGTLDPDGRAGGPLLQTLTTNRAQNRGIFRWTTYPEQLQARGISWKVYGNPDGNFGDNVLFYFQQYQDPSSPLFQNAFVPTFPGTFQADALAGTLPAVSWVLASLVDSEHPPGPPSAGEDVLHQVLTALAGNPAQWAKTAVIYTYDENGGYFDHVPPPVAPPGTPGEWITATPAVGGASILGDPPIRGPIGLGFRVPALVISPFSRGGFVSSDLFDHTSTLLLLERRFGAEVPGLSRWRRETVGDLVSAFNFAGPDASVPSLPFTAADPRGEAECVMTTNTLTLAGQAGTPYPIPNPQSLPHQERGTRRRPSGALAAATSSGPGGGTTPTASVPASRAAVPIAKTGLPSGLDALGLAAGVAALAAGGLVRFRRRREAEPEVS